MRKKITIRRENNKDLMILKVLATLLDYGADLKADDIPFYLDNYEENDKIIVEGDDNCIMKSAKYFDEIGIKYTID